MKVFPGLIALCLIYFTVAHGVYANTSSLDVSGTTGYVRVQNDPELNPSGGMTVEAWVFRNDASRCETVVGKNFRTSFWLGFCSSGIRFYTNGYGTNRDSPQPVPSGQWVHIAVTFDGSTRIYYQDGMVVYQASTPSTLPLNTSDLVIGADSLGDFIFDGNIAEARFWDHARTIDQIREYMPRIVTGMEPG
ncbi:MAG: LamG domain-containing protein, partial [Saprospiraceae bacterium]|nr:LamG domain-containing protein [Saprospiraceae bacterium]